VFERADKDETERARAASPELFYQVERNAALALGLDPGPDESDAEPGP